MLHNEDKIMREEARKFMANSHRGHKRANGSPYYYHPLRVAKVAERFSILQFTQRGLLMPPDQVRVIDLYLAGLLHDTIEDCCATYDDIARVTNIQVADLVAEISADHRSALVKRRVEYANRLGHATIDGKLLKLADLTHNLEDARILVLHNDDIAKDYLFGWPRACLSYLEAMDVLATSPVAIHWKWCKHAAECLERVLASWGRRSHTLSVDWPGLPPILRKP